MRDREAEHVFRMFVSENPWTAKHNGAAWALSEIDRLRQQVSSLAEQIAVQRQILLRNSGEAKLVDLGVLP